MKLKNILVRGAQIGASLLAPGPIGAGLSKAIGLLNRELPQPLPPGATAAEALAAYESLPPDRREVLDKMAEVELAEVNAVEDRLEAMVAAETPGANTRPSIAKMMAWLIFLAGLIAIGAWAYAVLARDDDMLRAVEGSWTLVLAILATPSAVVMAYFGHRSRDKANRYAAATGQPMPLVGAISGLLGAFRKGG